MANKRILFVDDEPLILQGLKRMLHGQRHEWEMEFAGDGVQALERMAQAPFDVVVSDMRMPGLNGAQLLTEVMRRYPRTVRIILSGHADKELILQCVGSTHQYLSKPCDPDSLKAVVRRATSLDYLRQHERLTTLVGQMEHLPTIPALYRSIVEVLNNPNTSIEDLSALIARDIAMTARILKLVNSAFFGLGRPIADTDEAVTHLGFDTVKSLVLAIGTFEQLSAKAPGAPRIDQIWTHSVTVSAYAKLIAREEGADRKIQDEAYVSGLLHDLGKLALLVNLPGDEHAGPGSWRRRRSGPNGRPSGRCSAPTTRRSAATCSACGACPCRSWRRWRCTTSPASGPWRTDFGPLAAVHAGNALAHGVVAGDGSVPARRSRLSQAESGRSIAWTPGGRLGNETPPAHFPVAT